MEIKAKFKSKSSPLTKNNGETKPLTDITNINHLIPISNLPSSAKKGSDNAANSSSMSDTSIGSSNFNHNANAAVNPNAAVEFTGKTHRVAPLLSPPLGREVVKLDKPSPKSYGQMVIQSEERKGAQGRKLILKIPCHQILLSSRELIIERLMSLNCQKRRYHPMKWIKKSKDI